MIEIINYGGAKITSCTMQQVKEGNFYVIINTNEKWIPFAIEKDIDSVIVQTRVKDEKSSQVRISAPLTKNSFFLVYQNQEKDQISLMLFDAHILSGGRVQIAHVVA